VRFPCGESLDHEFLVRQVRARGLEVAWDEVQG